MSALSRRVGNYWHMLPEAEQARKAIWAAVNPHTGMRRIDEAFPQAIRRRTREQEMSIEFANGSTWQVVGSDNFNSLVGATPVGIVFSEWSLANPAAWAFMRPILMENGGWAGFIYTPRGKNHAHKTHLAAQANESWFSETLSADRTGVFTSEQLNAELAEYIAEHGEVEGTAFFQQEYYCSFEAAILGSVYGSWMSKAEQAGRLGAVDYDPALPVFTAWDLGFDDATAIWWWQVARQEVRVIDYYESRGEGIDHYADVIKQKPYDYKNSRHYGPHDAANKLLAAGGRSIIHQLQAHGITMVAVPATSMQNSIAAARKTLDVTYFNTVNEDVNDGVEKLRTYHYKYDEKTRTLSKEPVHDWTSHASDAFEIIGQVWREQMLPKAPEPPRFPVQQSINELIAARTRARLEAE